jgi:hypothetical protein
MLYYVVRIFGIFTDISHNSFFMCNYLEFHCKIWNIDVFYNYLLIFFGFHIIHRRSVLDKILRFSNFSLLRFWRWYEIVVFIQKSWVFPRRILSFIEKLWRLTSWWLVIIFTLIIKSSICFIQVCSNILKWHIFMLLVFSVFSFCNIYVFYNWFVRIA